MQGIRGYLERSDGALDGPAIVKAHFGLALEYSKDKYDQPSAPDGQFNANRYGVFLRWNP